MTNPAEKIIQKYTFRNYYKYCFSVIGEDGKIYYLSPDNCNTSDIYRFSIDAEGYMEMIDEVWHVDGLPFTAHSL